MKKETPKFTNSTKEIQSSWIVVDKRKNTALCGAGNRTLTFSSKEIAEEVGKQFFTSKDLFATIEINNLN